MISSILSRLSVFNNGSVWALYLLHVIIRAALFCSLNILSDLKPHDNMQYCRWGRIKDRAHLSTFEFFILEKFSCIVVLIVFFVIVQSSGLISVWFRQKMTFFINFISFHIFAIYVGGACWGLPAACRLIAVSGARLPSVDGLTVRYIKNAPLLNLPSKYVCDLISNLFSIHVRAIQTYRDYAPVPTGSSVIYITGLTLVPAWISKCTHHKMWDEIIYPFPNFNGFTIEVWE